MYYQNELYHHGVKGMRWGVRKDRRVSANAFYKRDQQAALQKMKRTGDALKKSGRQNDVTAAKKMAEQYDKDLTRARAKRQIRIEGAKEYGVHYGRFGGTSIRDKQSGKKMRGSTRRAIERSIKAQDKQKYREYKRYKKAANSGLTYVGNNMNTAMMASVVNSATKGSRDEAQVKAQKMLIDYGNTYIKEIKGK